MREGCLFTIDYDIHNTLGQFNDINSPLNVLHKSIYTVRKHFLINLLVSCLFSLSKVRFWYSRSLGIVVNSCSSLTGYSPICSSPVWPFSLFLLAIINLHPWFHSFSIIFSFDNVSTFNQWVSLNFLKYILSLPLKVISNFKAIKSENCGKPDLNLIIANLKQSKNQPSNRIYLKSIHGSL